MGVLRVYGQPFRQVDERSLVAALGIEPALEDEIGLRKRYFDNNPWRLEAKLDLCRPAIKQGYDSIQLYHELCSIEASRHACGYEIISCHPSCLALRNRWDRAACVRGLPMRTGLNLDAACTCNQSHADGRTGMLNCAGGTSTSSQGAASSKVQRSMNDRALIRRSSNSHLGHVKSCECDWWFSY